MPTIRIGAEAVPYEGSPATRLYVLLGSPVAHSLSPRLQTAALRAVGLDAAFVACEVAPHELPEALRRLRQAAEAGRVGGANVTVPHKTAVLALLDDLDDEARATGAVNTIRIEAGPRAAAHDLRCVGHNTDVPGLVAALAEAGMELAGAHVVVLGAGGMARAAVRAALGQGAASIRVCSRSPWRAQEMLDDLAGAWTGRLPHLACAGLEAPAADLLHGAQVLIQATPLGLAPDDPSPVSLADAPADLGVFDSVYGAAETALVRQARARGLRAANGLGMLVHQGAAAFELWTGRRAPLAVMRRSVGLD
jgi:shikimate dehydrogenase